MTGASARATPDGSAISWEPRRGPSRDKPRDRSGGSASRPLFLLAQTDPLRVYISVPQSVAQLVQPGQAVVVTQGELREVTAPVAKIQSRYVGFFASVVNLTGT